MWYDLLVVGILLFFTIRGAVRGVIWQLAGIAGIVLCFFFAQSISAMIGPRINLEPPLNHWVALFAAYLFFSFIAFGVARLLNDWVERAQLKEFNRHLGAVFGLVKGVLLYLILTFMLVTVSESARESLKYSRSGRYAAIIMDRLHPVMPEKLHDALAQYIHRLDSPDLPLEHRDHDHDVQPVLPGGSDPFAPILGAPLGATGGNSSLPGQSSSSPVQSGNEFWTQLRNSLGTDVQNAFINALGTTDPSLKGQLQNKFAQILRSTPPEQIPVLKEQLLQGGPGRMDQVLSNWLASTAPNSATAPAPQPGTTIPPSPATPNSNARSRSALVQEVSSYLTSVPATRASMEQQLNDVLAAIPNSVADAVLQDLLIDLRGAGNDPDPGTTRGTKVEQRILRQLQFQRIPMTALNPQMQNWLRQAQAMGASPL